MVALPRGLRARPHERVTLIMVGFSLLKQPSRSNTSGERKSFEWTKNTVLATIADGKTAVSWGRRAEKLKKLNLSLLSNGF